MWEIILQTILWIGRKASWLWDGHGTIFCIEGRQRRLFKNWLVIPGCLMIFWRYLVLLICWRRLSRAWRLMHIHTGWIGIPGGLFDCRFIIQRPCTSMSYHGLVDPLLGEHLEPLLILVLTGHEELGDEANAAENGEDTNDHKHNQQPQWEPTKNRVTICSKSSLEKAAHQE